MGPGPAAQLHQLEGKGGKEPQPDHHDAGHHAGAPPQTQAHVSPAVGPETTAPADDEHLLLRDDGDHGGGGHSTDMPVARPHLEERRVVRVPLREDPLDLAAASACEGEPDAVGKPVTGDRARGVEPPALAQCDRHPRPVPRYPAVRNSPS